MTPRIAFAASGTGGHLFPGLALAEEARRRFPAGRFLFFGSGRPLEGAVLGGAGFARLDLPRIERPSSARAIPALARAIPAAILGAARALQGGGFRVLVGLGGGAALAPALAAGRLGIPVVLLEQNARPGRTTRLLARGARWVSTQWPGTEGEFPGAASVHADGSPLRDAILAGPREPRPALGLEEGTPTVLVLGGSQGAAGVNRLLEAAIPLLAARPRALQFAHVAGEPDRDRIAAAYAAAGIRAAVFPFCADMASLYAAADLVVSRAGGTTLAEIAHFGRPAILVPFPAAADDHQAENARRFAALGGAEVIPEGPAAPARLARRIQEILDDRTDLARRSAASRGLDRPDARARILARILADVA